MSYKGPRTSVLVLPETREAKAIENLSPANKEVIAAAHGVIDKVTNLTEIVEMTQADKQVLLTFFLIQSRIPHIQFIDEKKLQQLEFFLEASPLVADSYDLIAAVQMAYADIGVTNVFVSPVVDDVEPTVPKPAPEQLN